MKQKATLITMLLTLAAFAQSFYSASIVFDTSGTKPAVTGIPYVLKQTGLTLTGFGILSYSVSGDSVVINAQSTERAPIDPIEPFDSVKESLSIITLPTDTTIRFNEAGTYKFYLRSNMDVEPFESNQNGVIIIPRLLKFLGSVRILPLVKTTPGIAIAGDSIIMRLTLGEKVGCDDNYFTSYEIRNDSLFLSYRINPSMPICIMPIDPVPFGPIFRIAPQTNNLAVIIEDTLFIGDLKVYEPKIVSGKVTDVTDSKTPLYASIIAFMDNGCSDELWLQSNEKDTTSTITDRSGYYSIKIPNDGNDYRIEALPDPGSYKMQAAYTSVFPSSRSVPPISTIDFALIPVETNDTVQLIVKVTNNGVPVPGVTVNMSPGRESLFCILPYGSIISRPGASNTDSNGVLAIKNLPLVPFTWYAWSCFGGTPSVNERGMVLLSPVKNDTLFIEIDPTSIEKVAEESKTALLAVKPNPFNPATEISFGKTVSNVTISIFSITGKKVMTANNFSGSSLLWNAEGISAGTYIVRAKIDGKTISAKALLSR